MKFLLGICWDVIIVAGVTLVIKKTLDIEKQVSARIKSEKNKKKLEDDGYIVVNQ